MKPFFVLFICLMLVSSPAFTTHLKAGHITVTQTEGLTYKITVHVFTNDKSEVRFSQGGAGTIDFGDGSPVHHPPEQLGIRYDRDVAYVEYSVFHDYVIVTGTFAAKFQVTYVEPNFNGGILNMSNSITTPFSLQTTITADPSLNYSSPKFPVGPILSFPLTEQFSFSAATTDTTHRTYYELVTPQFAQGFFYPPSMTIDSFTGLVSWDTKFNEQFAAGEFVLVVRATQYDDDDNLLGWCNRVIDVVVADSESQISVSDTVSSEHNVVVVGKGETVELPVLISDTNAVDSVRIKLSIDPSLDPYISLTQKDSVSETRRYRVGTLTIHPDGSVERTAPYVISLRGTSYSTSLTTLIDINFLWLTKDVPLKPQPDVKVGIENKNAPRISPYPNPFSRQLYFGQDVAPGTIAVFYDAQGRAVFTAQIHNDFPVDTSLLPAGFYVLEISNVGGRTRVKAVKQ